MSKLTIKEQKEFMKYLQDFHHSYEMDMGLFINRIDDCNPNTRNTTENFFNYLEQKKKEWQDEAVAEYKLKKEMETKFYTSGSGDSWKWKCIKCGTEGGLYDAHYGVVGGYVCNNCLTNRP